MYKFLTIALLIFFVGMGTYAQTLTIKTPHANETIRYGMSYNLSWDTTGTYNKTFQFYYSANQTGPWTQLLLTKGTTEFKDSTKNLAAVGNVNASFPNVPTLWLKMQLKSDANVNTVVGPISIKVPQAATVDSVITGPITSNLRLSATKIYGLKGVVFVRSGATLTIDPGAIIFGEVGTVNCLCINRGAKIMAQGTAQKPIIFTSGVVAGQRDRGDWGGLVIMGKSTCNNIESPIEGGIADDATKKTDGWYGGTDIHDNSGVLSYVRIEFAGIAATPDNELNGLTLGAVGDGTTIDHVQVSYSGDDSFEWFGGTVNCKYMIAYNGIDDDFDTDNGFSGKLQFGLVKRTSQIADISNSEAFESDNDANASENQPFTKVVFSNFTVLGAVQDTSWTSGLGSNQYHPRFLTAAQIRRNSRMSLLNSVIVGWPAGVEMTNNNTVRAAGVDSIYVRYNDFYGIKKDKFFYLGSGTTAAGTVDANWLSTVAYGNVFVNGTGKTDQLAYINDGFSVSNSGFNPLPMSNAPYLTTAKYDVPVLTDSFFEKVAYRGAFGSTRWDMPWAEYDPVNKDYKVGGNTQTLTIKTPHANETIRYGMSYNLSWDTTGTYNKTFQFYYSANQTGPWTQLLLTKGTTEFKDSTKNLAAVGNVNASFPNVPTLWLKMQLKSDANVNTVVGPISIKVPQAATVDSVITGPITSNLRLSATKIYGLKGVVFVRSGATLTIDPGAIIFGEVGTVNCLCINRGAKIMAQGTAQKPIIFTSGVVAGQRDRGDWGGLVIMGKSTCNNIESPIEGGIADDATKKTDGWYGGTDIHDNSGVLSYVRIEFAGIAATPDNELNGLTLGAVGDGTTIDHVQVSYSGDDSFEWFGGTVNCKYMIAYNGIDDDFDTDNGFSGKLQFGLVKRTSQIADISNSEAFESDNDANASENQPFTKVVFSNFTVLGAVQDTSWSSGLGANQYHPRFLTAAQIRRNSRMSLLNSVIVGWPAGVEMTNNNTVRAAGVDSLYVRYNNFYGIKKDKFFYLGSGTTAAGTVDANWLSTAAYGNVFVNGTGKTDQLAYINDGFSVSNSGFNPLPMSNAPYLTTAKYDVPVLTDSFFEKVAYRGAFGSTRWDMPWAEYDPVNKDYKVGTDVNEEVTVNGLNIKITPVPANDFINVNYSLFTNENVSIKIYDITGSYVSTLLDNVSQISGFYSYNFVTNYLNAGVYLLQIQTSNNIQSKMLYIVK